MKARVIWGILSWWLIVSIGQAANYQIVEGREPFYVGKTIIDVYKEKGIDVTIKNLVIPFGHTQIVLSIQEYLPSDNSLPENAPGILFGHGWSSNNMSWFHNIEEAIRNGHRPISVIWPGHGVMFEPLKKGAMRSYIEVEGELEHYSPYQWVEVVGKALNDYMHQRFGNNFIYWGHSMGDIIGSYLNHKGILNPRLLVLVGGPGNFDHKEGGGNLLNRVVAWGHRVLEKFPQLQEYTGVFPTIVNHSLFAVPRSHKKLRYQSLVKILKHLDQKEQGMFKLVKNYPELLAVGPFHRKYITWFASLFKKDYPWRELALKTPTIFVWGENEQIPPSALRKTYQARGRNIWWMEVILKDRDHFGELDKGSSKAIWSEVAKSKYNPPIKGTVKLIDTNSHSHLSECLQSVFRVIGVVIK